MLSRNKIKIILFALMVVWVTSTAAISQTIAVFPMEDLSIGVNSPNMELTRILAEEMKARGLNVILEEDIISFMAKNRLRWLGYLETEQIILTKENLGADLVLFGTISQKKDKNSPSYGLSFYLVRTRDAKTIWTSSGGLSLVDMQRLLGLNEPTTVEELLPVLIKNVLSSWPSDLDSVLQQPLLFNLEQGEKPPILQVKEIRLTPRYVRPGEVVKCVVELEKNFLMEEYEPQIYIRAGNRIHLAQQSPEELYYEASWTGSEIEKGIFREVGNEALYLAAKDLVPQYFEGVWTGLDEDDVYPVSLILKWPTGEQQMAYVGKYTVDSKPPDLDMHLKGKEVDGIISFRDKIVALPTYNVREPLSHWQISVESDLGRVLIGDEGDGNLPRNFFWKGQLFNGFPAEEGVYNLVLNVWDRAGNMSTIAREIAYRPSPPEMYMEVVKLKDSLQLKLSQDDTEVPLAYWRLEIWGENGELLKNVDGEELPFEYNVPTPQGPETPKIKGLVLLKDILGNQTRLEIDDLYLIAMNNLGDETEKTSKSNKDSDENKAAEENDKDSDDSWVWLSKF